MSKRLSARIHVSRVFGHGVIKPVVIEISDELSGEQIVNVEMTLDQYGDLVSGSGTVDCALDLYESTHFGKRIESKTEFVPFNCFGWYKKPKELTIAAAKAAKPFLVDGWESYQESDFSNPHYSTKRKGVKGQNVAFWRYVEVSE